MLNSCWSSLSPSPESNADLSSPPPEEPPVKEKSPEIDVRVLSYMHEVATHSSWLEQSASTTFCGPQVCVIAGTSSTNH